MNPPLFPIGVWQQPPASFAAWKARGINTLVCIPTPASSFPTAAWSAAADAAGLWQVRPPLTTAAEEDDPYLLAFQQPDEPDANGQPPALWQQNYAAWKAAKPTIPVFGNFSGGYVLQIQGNWTKSQYAPFLAAADALGSDFYPAAGWGNVSPQYLQNPGRAIQTLAGYAPGKPVYAFIETANQFVVPVSMQPTAEQVSYETWHAILCGARGICYFPIQLGAVFSFDGTPPQTAQAIAENNRGIAAIAPHIGSGLVPSAIAAGWEYGSATTAAGKLEVLLNVDQYQVCVYGGNPVPPCGVYCIYTPAGGSPQVIYQTPLPSNNLAPLQQQVTTLVTEMTALRNALNQ